MDLFLCLLKGTINNLSIVFYNPQCYVFPASLCTSR